MTFDAVFFDFGGVLSVSPFQAFAVYEQREGLPPDAVRTVNATNPDTNAWARLERSEITIEQFIEQFEHEAVALGFHLDGAAVLACLEVALIPEMVEVVRRCSRRLVTGLLTNNVVPSTGLDGLLDLFDVIVESSAEGVRKPDPAFYRLACERAGVTPERVVFLDDLGINLKSARDLGMHTIKVTDPLAAAAELAGLLELD